ncbi:nitrite reductase [Nocardioides sp. GXZ039]|uniref:nitrite reductase n=1 Tax=Nocardioides sp. GXZ039 TaxID=3136018 RepID=UPI0030F3AF9B
MSAHRTRTDRCPGVLRPWEAADGLLVRLRLIGGRVSSTSLRLLSEAAEAYGDGRVHVTSRANLQVRGLPGTDGRLDDAAVRAIEETGLLPAPTHDLVRNVMVSPQTGLAGGRADLRPVAEELDRRIRASAELATLPGRFLFVLDDGRGDLMERTCDLGVVALDADVVALRVGTHWAGVVPCRDAAARLAGLADLFLTVRGSGRAARWHVADLDRPLVTPTAADPRVPEPAPPLPYGQVPGGRHVPVPEGGLDRDAVLALGAEADQLVVTPWRGVLVPGVGTHG